MKQGIVVKTLLTSLALLSCSAIGRAANFVVTSNADNGPGTLRQAIMAANGSFAASGQSNSILFRIGSGPATIQPATALPTINGPVTINGATQPGFSGAPLVEISGANAPFGTSGLTFEVSQPVPGNVVPTVVKDLVINRFQSNGILIKGNSKGVRVFNCYIGITRDGKAAARNLIGVALEGNAQGCSVGGTGPREGNVISGNDQGVSLYGFQVASNAVQGNTFGRSADGQRSVINAGAISVTVGAHDNLIGGSTAGARNTIEGGFSGIGIGGDNNRVQGNLIRNCIKPTQQPLDNSTGVGIYINGGRNNIIGGTAPGEGNVLTLNESDGVLIDGDNTRIRGNRIFKNGGLGINLLSQNEAPNTPTPNDSGDGDTGPNNLQNAPRLYGVSVFSGGTPRINGILESTPNSKYVIDFYRSTTADPSGFGEGEFYIGSVNATTDSNGVTLMDFSLHDNYGGQFLTATATNAAGDTSEFSNVAEVPTSVEFSTSNFRVNENAGVATITLKRTGTDLPGDTAEFTVEDGGTAIRDEDYTAGGGTQYNTLNVAVHFEAGATTATGTFPIINDTIDEPDQTVKLKLDFLNAGSAFPGIPATATLTIVDDDPEPSLSVQDLTISERYGDGGQDGVKPLSIFVSLSAPSEKSITVSYTTVNGTAKAPEHYVTTSGTFTLGPRELGKSLTLLIKQQNDDIDEPDKQFYVLLSNLVNARIGKGRGVVTIKDGGEMQAAILAGDVTLQEGNAGTRVAVFPLRLSKPSGFPVKVNYATADGVARAGSDYVAVPPTTVTFAPGVTTAFVRVVVNGDTLPEADESFYVLLSSPQNAYISTGRGKATITNDDHLPALSISDANIVEGNTGTKTLTFVVNRNLPSGQTVTAHFTTIGNTARAASDYQDINGTISIPPNKSSATIELAIIGDTQIEPSEVFFVLLSSPQGAVLGRARATGTINNDDQPTGAAFTTAASVQASSSANSVTLTFADAKVAQAASGFTVKLNGKIVNIQNVERDGASITLLLPAGILKAGDEVTMGWNGGSQNLITQ